MSCCPSVRVRNTGSGYVKESGGCDEAKQQLAARLAERAAQDARIWGPMPAPAPSATTTTMAAKIEKNAAFGATSTRK